MTTINLCDLRHVRRGPNAYFTLIAGELLVLTASPADVVACMNCPNMHVKVLSRVTAARVRELARDLSALAAVMEQRGSL